MTGICTSRDCLTPGKRICSKAPIIWDLTVYRHRARHALGLISAQRGGHRGRRGRSTAGRHKCFRQHHSILQGDTAVSLVNKEDTEQVGLGSNVLVRKKMFWGQCTAGRPLLFCQHDTIRKFTDVAALQLAVGRPVGSPVHGRKYKSTPTIA